MTGRRRLLARSTRSMSIGALTVCATLIMAAPVSAAKRPPAFGPSSCHGSCATVAHRLIQQFARAHTSTARANDLLGIMRAAHLPVYAAHTGKAVSVRASFFPGHLQLYDFELRALADEYAGRR